MSRNHPGCRRLLALMVAIATLSLPATAHAHPRLKRSIPGAAERLEVAPVAVRLWFSEAPELALTKVTLTDQAGNAIAVGPVVRDDSSALGVRARIVQPLAPGNYTVHWSSAAADGHPTHGDFSFVVLPSSTSMAHADSMHPLTAAGVQHQMPDSASMHVSPSTAHEMSHHEEASASGVAFTVVRAASYCCILLVVGAVIFQFGVLRRADIDVALLDRTASRMALVGATSALVLIAAAAARLLLQVRILGTDAGTAGTSVAEVVGNTRWGLGWQLQVAATVIAGASLLFARRSKAGWMAAALAALVLVCTPALGGHAASSPRLTVVAIAADAAHVLGASGWLGGLLLMTVVAIPVMARDGGTSNWKQIASMVQAFSPVALTCAALLALTGGFAAWLHVGSLAALWTSNYGRTLVIKLAVIGLLVASGAVNWLRMRPVLGNADATRKLTRTAIIELAIGACVILVTAVLVAVEPPMQ